MPDQKDVRADIRKSRENLSVDDRASLSSHIVNNVLEINPFDDPTNIGFYLAFNGEVLTQALIQQALAQEKACYLPTLHPHQLNHLVYMPYQVNTALKANRYGIDEIAYDETIAIQPSELDCVFVPLVAFDQNCHRIGMGAGFYDRSFAFKHKDKTTRPTMIGLAYEFQRTNEIDVQPWDVALDIIVTEKEIYQK